MNSIIARRNIRIRKGVLAARDKRMGVLNELIRAVCTFFFLFFYHPILQFYNNHLLLRQVKFVKLFAWEERWINRVMDSREAEMKWMVKGKCRCVNFFFFLKKNGNKIDLWDGFMIFKGRFNSVLFYALWTFAPIFISITSFFTYVMLGNQLTIGVAFTVNFFIYINTTPSFFVMSHLCANLFFFFSKTGDSVV